MQSKIAASHARIAKFWIRTDKYWKNAGLRLNENGREYTKFLNGMIACLSSCVTDEEWEHALKVAEDTLRISGERKEGTDGETEATGEGEDTGGLQSKRADRENFNPYV